MDIFHFSSKTKYLNDIASAMRISNKDLANPLTYLWSNLLDFFIIEN